MNINFRRSIYFAVFALMVSLGISASGQNPYRVSDKEVKKVINKLDHETDNFKGEIGHPLDKDPALNGTKREDRIKDFMEEFEKATDTLHNNFTKNSSAAGDVQDVLLKGRAVNRFMRAHDLGKANSRWVKVRGYLDTLAGYYNVTVWDWMADDPWPVEP